MRSGSIGTHRIVSGTADFKTVKKLLATALHIYGQLAEYQSSLWPKQAIVYGTTWGLSDSSGVRSGKSPPRPPGESLASTSRLPPLPELDLRHPLTVQPPIETCSSHQLSPVLLNCPLCYLYLTPSTSGKIQSYPFVSFWRQDHFVPSALAFCGNNLSTNIPTPHWVGGLLARQCVVPQTTTSRLR